MKKILWLKYLILFVLMAGLMFLDRYIDNYMAHFPLATMDAIRYGQKRFFISAIINIIIGVLLGLEYFVTETKKVGHWKFNWLRVVILSIPSLYLIISPFFITGINRIAFYIYQPMITIIASWANGLKFLPVIQVLFGYWFITSFSKYADEVSSAKDVRQQKGD